MIYYLRNNTKVIFGYVQPIIDDAKFTLKLKNTVTNQTSIISLGEAEIVGLTLSFDVPEEFAELNTGSYEYQLYYTDEEIDITVETGLFIVEKEETPSAIYQQNTNFTIYKG